MNQKGRHQTGKVPDSSRVTSDGDAAAAVAAADDDKDGFSPACEDPREGLKIQSPPAPYSFIHSTFYASTSPQWLIELKRLWPSGP